MSDRGENLVICGALRTPFSFGNRLKALRSEVLLGVVLAELLKKYRLDPKTIDMIAAGSVQQDTKAPNVARIASLQAGFGQETNAYSIQANCNSGFVGLLTVLGHILSGDAGLGVAAGVESMSNFGFRLNDKTGMCSGKAEIEDKLKAGAAGFLDEFSVVDCLEEGLKDQVNDMAMLEVAEVMAHVYGVTRQEADAYALQNLARAVRAVEGNRLAGYLVGAGGLAQDNYPLNRKRMLANPALFSKAPPVFGPDSEFLNTERFAQKHKKSLDSLGFHGPITPTVTMYNSCIPGDGAGALIVAEEERALELGLVPRLRVISWASVGVNPVVMGIGPCEAVHAAFTRPKTRRAQGLEMDRMDVIEIHEAFASQALSVFKESEKKYRRAWNQEKVNVYGGSLAYTHPLGATNMRLVTDILSRFDEDPAARYAMACGCAGGGQGTAFVFERYER